MPKKVSQKALQSEYEWQPTKVTQNDFADGDSNGSTISAGSQPAEVAVVEVGDPANASSQFDSYDVVRFGQPIDPTGRSAQGKVFMDLETTTDGTDVDQRTQVRLIARPKNGDDRTALTDWFVLDDLNESDVSKRIPLPPTTDADGDPQYVQDGRVVALEVRNPATSIEVSRSNSDIRIPAVVGY